MRGKGLSGIFLLIPFLLTIILCGCKAPLEEDALKAIKEKLKNVTSYQALVNLQLDHKDSSIYTLRQFYKKAGNFRSEVVMPEEMKGLVTVFDGMTSTTFHPGINMELTFQSALPDNGNRLFLTEFLRAIQDDTVASFKVQEWKNGKKYAVMEVVTPGPSKFFTSEKLWVDLETYNPYRLEVYGADNDRSIVMEYMDFQYNVKLEDKLFKINKQ